MRVLHIGGHRPIIDSIVSQFAHREIAVAAAGTHELSDITSLTADQLVGILEKHSEFDIYHLHDPAPLLEARTPSHGCLEATLRKEVSEGKKFIMSLDGDAILSPHHTDFDRDAMMALIKEFVAAVLLGSAEWYEIMKDLDNWSWLGNPIDVRSIPVPKTYLPPETQTRILYLPFHTETAASERISKLISNLSQQNSQLVLTIKPVHSFKDLSEFRNAIAGHDIIVERVSRPMYGWVALESMAHGKTVLSGIHPHHRREWKQLEYSPVLDSSEETVVKRILTLIQEPRSMRDIGNRSRNFVESYHEAEQVVAMMLELYGQL